MIELIEIFKNINKSFEGIAILGKGSNLLEEYEDIPNNYLKIGLNDTCCFVKTDINIIKDQWAYENIKKNNIESFNICGPNIKTISDKREFKFDKVADEGENFEKIISAISSKSYNLDSFYNVNFINAILLSRAYEAETKQKLKKLFVGFNFDVDKTLWNKRSKKLLSPETNLSFQKELLDLIMSIDKSIVFKSFDNAEISDVAIVKNFSWEKSNIIMVAEITTNHFGDRERLHKILKSCVLQGATPVKLQKRDPDTFYSRDQLNEKFSSPFGNTFADYRRALELTDEDFQFVDDFSKRHDVEWYISAIDMSGFKLALHFERELIKLPSTISKKIDYLNFVSKNYSKSIAISTGMTDQDYEDWLLKSFKNNDKLYLMQCNSAYPTPPEHTDINVVRHYHDLKKNNPKIIPGYSSHDHGSFASCLAVAAGAEMIEKHVKYGNAEWAHFDSVALDLKKNEYGLFCEDIKKALIYCGSSKKRINDSEHHKY